jgi:hypothetical protein
MPMDAMSRGGPNGTPPGLAFARRGTMKIVAVTSRAGELHSARRDPRTQATSCRKRIARRSLLSQSLPYARRPADHPKHDHVRESQTSPCVELAKAAASGFGNRH